MQVSEIIIESQIQKCVRDVLSDPGASYLDQIQLSQFISHPEGYEVVTQTNKFNLINLSQKKIEFNASGFFIDGKPFREGSAFKFSNLKVLLIAKDIICASYNDRKGVCYLFV